MPEAAHLPLALHYAQQRFRDDLSAWLASAELAEPQLHDAVHYAMSNGGKRVRPALVWAACQAVSGNQRAADAAAFAIECIHGYSLVHDDLPCMDDDDLRRGLPTCHKRFDEATALLAGDSLQSIAFAALMQSTLSAEIKCQQTAVLAQAAQAMVIGQRLDLAAEGRAISQAELERLHSLKTGALICAAVQLGCLAGGGDAQAQQVLLQFAQHLGLAFQVHDDVLDVIGDTQTLGKTVGADASLQKSTFPALLGLDAARNYAAELTRRAIEALQPLGEQAASLRAVAQFLLQRDH